VADFEVSVIIPARNEARSIAQVIAEVRNVFQDRFGYEILVVDTLSTDGTDVLAERGGARLIREDRRGYGRAYKTGFSLGQGKYLLSLDADLTYPATAFLPMLELLRLEADFVSGDRLSGLSPDAMRTLHRVGNGVLNAAFRALFRFPIRDSQSGMWALKRSVWESLRVGSDGMPFSEEIKIAAIRQGFRFREIPITYRPRVGETKLASWSDGWKGLAHLFRLRFRRSSMPPL